MARRRKTWKSDPKANDHSALLSAGLGRHVSVKNTRGEKALKGQIGSSEKSRYDNALYRHVSDPFEISLISVIRQESELPPLKAVEVVERVLYRYIRALQESTELTQTQKEEVRELEYFLRGICSPIFNGIDTLRCSEMANKRYFRTTCGKLSKESLNKGLDMIVRDPKLRMYEAKWNWADKQIYYAVMNKILNSKTTNRSVFTEPIPDVVGEGYSFESWEWDLIHKAIDKHIDEFNKLAQGIGGSKDVIQEVIRFAISLLHIMGEIPEPTGSGVGEITNDEDGEITFDEETEPDMDKRKKGGGNDSWQIHYKVELDGQTFNEYVQSVWDKLLTDEKKEIEESGGGSFSTKSHDDERRTTVYTMPSDYSGDMADHTVIVKEYPCDPVDLHANTVNLLNDVERNGFSRKGRVGIPTHEIWKLKTLGDTKVFAKSPKKSGELIILVDCSGSMGYADQEGNAGYDAFQVSSAISEVFPMAQTYAFNSDNSKCYAYLIPNGMMIGRSARKQGFDYGGNSDCSALLFMEQLMTGKTQDSLAVIISDGSPAPPSPLRSQHLHTHTKSVSHRLYEQGLRFVSVLVGGYANQEYYPSDVAVQLNGVQDMHLVGDAIARIGQTFN